MGIRHFVPDGKVLVIPIGGYRFVGPRDVKMSGNLVLPETYEDGTPLVRREVSTVEKITDSIPVVEFPEVSEEATPAVVPMPIAACPETSELSEEIPDYSGEPALGPDYRV